MTDLADRFLELHRPGRPLLQPNAWDSGSARLLESLGFQAIATTSSGYAATLGRLDGSVNRDEALAHGAAIAGAVDVPVAAAVEAAHAGPRRLVVTARAENHLHGRTDLADTIARLVAYQEAGADVLFAPGAHLTDEIRSIVTSVDRPVNVLGLAGCPPVPELADLGVARISVGGAFAYAALAALIDAATELRGDGHVALLTAAGLDGCEAHALFAIAEGAPADLYQQSRGWSDDEWQRALDGLRSRRLLDRGGASTPEGRTLRDRIEQRTDELAAKPFADVDDHEIAELLRTLGAAADRIVASGEISFPNPMGLPRTGT